MKSLVLGGNGFIGSHVCEHLAQKGHAVVCFDLFRKKTIVDTASSPGTITLCKGNFFRPGDLDRALRNTEYVFHFASATQPYSATKKPEAEDKNVLLPTLRLLELCVKHKVKRIVFPSSGGLIYGNQLKRSGLLSEKEIPRPVLPHAIMKLTIERMLRYFYQMYRLDFCVLRLSNIYGPRGPREGSQGVVTIFMNKILGKERPVIFNEGKEIRDYLYVTDAARAIVLSAENRTQEKVFNVGSGRGYAILSLFNKIKKLCGSPIAPVFSSGRKYSPQRVVLDSSVFMKKFGWKPHIDLDSGLEKTLAWFTCSRNQNGTRELL